MIRGIRIAEAAGTLFLALLIVVGCGGADTGDDPRKVVISMFGAMEKDDKAALAHVLDLAELMRTGNDDYAMQTNQPRTFVSPQEILDDLTGDGKTKKRWFSLQRIVNEAEIMGETATVEVTFVDKDASHGYRTKFGLHKKEGKWRIYSFKTINEAP